MVKNGADFNGIFPAKINPVSRVSLVLETGETTQAPCSLEQWRSSLERMMPLEQRALRQLNMCLLYKAMSKVTLQLYAFGSMHFEGSENKRKRNFRSDGFVVRQ